MHDNDYDNSIMDAFRYLSYGLEDDMEWDEDEEHPPMVGLDKWLDLEAKKAMENVFVNTGVDFSSLEPKNICEHLWVSYRGLNEQYDFCKNCDVKK